jgi:hypothetical protein
MTDQLYPCLFTTGPCRIVRDHTAGGLRIETTADNEAGEGLLICRLPTARVAEARAIACLTDLLRSQGVFAALGCKLVGADPDAPLISNPKAELAISVGDMHFAASIHARAVGSDPSLQSGHHHGRRRRSARFNP